MLTIQIQGDKELIAKMNIMPERVRTALFNKVAYLASMLKTYIIDNKLSGQVLNHRSGDLWRSIRDEATQSSSSVEGRVYSTGVPYAAIHEFGGTIASHVIESKTAGALAFMWQGKQVFFKKVTIPDVKMPERSFMRSSLADKRQEIIDGMNEAVMGALQ